MDKTRKKTTIEPAAPGHFAHSNPGDIHVFYRALDLLFSSDADIPFDVQAALDINGILISNGAISVVLFAPCVQITSDLPILQIMDKLQTLVSDCFSGHCIHYLTQYQGTIAVICYFPRIAKEDCREDEIWELLYHLSLSVTEQYQQQGTLMCAISDVAYELNSVHHLFLSALNTTIFQEFCEQQSGPVRAYAECDLLSICMLHQDMQKQARNLATLIYRQEMNAAGEQLNMLLDSLVSCHISSVRHVHFALHLFLSVLTEELLDLNIVSPQYLSHLNTLNLVLSAKRVSEIRHYLTEFLSDIHTHYVARVSLQNSACMQQAKEYLDNHLFDANLTVQEVASTLSMSLSSFSKMFKHCYRQTPSAYIRECRVAKAKQLLKEGVSLNDIVDQVGFGSLNTLYRAIKQVEGLTPGTFRN